MHCHLVFPQGRVSSGLGAGGDTFCALLSLGLFLVVAGGMESVSSGTSTHPLSFPPRRVPHSVPFHPAFPPRLDAFLGFVPLGDESQVESR